MDTRTSLLSMEPIAATRMISRRRPLHTCGVSMSAIARKACTKAQDFKGPIGSMNKRVIKLATSNSLFIYAMQFQWLAFLSFVDDHILAIENVAETLFPPSSYLFNKIDELVQVVEALPGRFDNAVHKFPILVHQVPLLDWALFHVISWLNFLISTLTYWGSGSEREKEITVDINCNEHNNEAGSVGTEQQPLESPTYAKSIMKCTYKEMLEKGTKENEENKEDSCKDVIQENISREDTGKVEDKKSSASNEGTTNIDDPILELFESAWHMKAGRGSSGSLIAHPIS